MPLTATLSPAQESALRWAYCLTAPRDPRGDWPAGSWRNVPAAWLGERRTVRSLVRAGLLEEHGNEAGVAAFRITARGVDVRRAFL